MYFSSNTTTSALLLSKQLSNSSTCSSLSNGTDTIPPKRFVKCARAHSYLFLPTTAILLFLYPNSNNFVPNAFISSNNLLYDTFSYSTFLSFMVVSF